MDSITALIDDLLKHPPASRLELASRSGDHDPSALIEAMLGRLLTTDCTPRDQGIFVLILAELLAFGERTDALRQVLEDPARAAGSRALAFILLQSLPDEQATETLRRLPREDVESIFAAALEWTDRMASVELEPGRENAGSSSVSRSREKSAARGKEKRGTPKKPRRLLTMKIALRGARPPIWRRLVVPDDMTFAELHDVIQMAFNWWDEHLHTFEVGRTTIGPLDIADLAEIEEADVTLRDGLGREKKFSYTYDFGDDWIHDVMVEKTEPGPPGKRPAARCIGGRRAAPPEDCGGVWGYARLLQVLADPGDPEHDELKDWAGEIDPAEFDVGEVDRRLAGSR